MPMPKLGQDLDKTALGGCWLWVSSIDQQGYGMSRAHRVAYTVLRGPIPAGLVLDHLCRVRNCINPDHLEPVTIATNTRRGIRPPSVKKTECLRGHPFDEANTRIRPDGTRKCRTCSNAEGRQRKERAKNARKQEVTA